MSFFWTCMQTNSVYEISEEDNEEDNVPEISEEDNVPKISEEDDIPEISEEDAVVEGDL